MTTEPYRPSNGTEGAIFMASFCNRCSRDDAFQKGEGSSCPIVAATLTFNDDDPRYPPEWVRDIEDGEWPGTARCTAFEPLSGDGPISDARQLDLLEEKP